MLLIKIITAKAETGQIKASRLCEDEHVTEESKHVLII
jgi:hypothetical protein